MKTIVGLLVLSVGWMASGANAWMQQARKATRTGARSYKLGPYGFAIVTVGL